MESSDLGDSVVICSRIDQIINMPRSEQGRRDGYEIRLAKAEHIPKSTMARKFIEERLEQCRIGKAIELYVNEKGILKEISEITGVTVHMIMKTLRKKNIPLRMMEHARMVFGF